MDPLSERQVLWAKYLAYGLGFLVLISIPLQFWYLFSGQSLSGWDTPGHIVLAKEFAKLVPAGSATGWSEVWFGGFPIFYFYPPFYYLIVYCIHILFSVSVESAFSISIFFTILLLFYAIYSFSKQFLWSLYPRYMRILFGFSAVLFYFNYAGDGLQGTSLVGIVEGTVISSFAHSLIFLGLVSIDKYRKSYKLNHLVFFVGLTSVIFYSHLLSSIFYSLILFLYFVEYRSFVRQNIKRFCLAAFVIFFLILPVVYNYIRFSEYTSGVFYGHSYPPLLSILGKDVYDTAMKASVDGGNITLLILTGMFSSGRWLSLVAVIIFVFNFRNFHTSIRSKFITTVIMIFLWFSLDSSFGFIFPNIKIHNYRAFDCFFIAFSILFPYSLRSITGKGKLPLFPVIYFALIIQFFLFLSFNPSKYQDYVSPIWQNARTEEELAIYRNLTERLKSLPKNALVQPEIIKSKSMFGTPHFWLPLLYNAGVRNNLGLTVESSYYSTLVFNWQEFGFGHTFRWGTDVDWRDQLLSLGIGKVDSGYYLDFLFRSGVTHMIGFSPEYQNYINVHAKRLEIVAVEHPFVIVKILSNPNLKWIKPIGLIHSELLNSNSEYGYRDFLKTSNFLQMHIANLGYQTKFLRITKTQLNDIDSILPFLSSVILVTKENGLGEVSWIQGLNKKNISASLVRESDFPLVTDSISTQNISVLLNQVSQVTHIHQVGTEPQSYFRERRISSGELMLDDTAREFFVSEEKNQQQEKPEVLLSSFGGKLYLLGMVISFLLLLGGLVFTKTPYFSFSKTKR